MATREIHAMHPLYEQASALTQDVIAASIEVHRDKGPGLLESIYEWCLSKELELRGHSVQTQQLVVIRYKGYEREVPLQFDLLVNGCLLIEIKAVQAVSPIHKAQLLSYMKLIGIPLGLLINFNVERLAEGVCRLILPNANLPD